MISRFIRGDEIVGQEDSMAHSTGFHSRLAVLILLSLPLTSSGAWAFAGVQFAAAPPYECTSLKLVSACGLPNGSKHSYALEGICNYWDGESHRNVWVKAGDVYTVADHSAIEAVEVEGVGKMSATFKCDDDPWATHTTCAVEAFNADSGPMEKFADPYYSEKQPFSRKYVNPTTAVQMSQSCNQNPAPPPPPPPAKKTMIDVSPGMLEPLAPAKPEIKPIHMYPITSGGDGGSSQGPPEVPQISEPTKNLATCGSLPVGIHAGGATTGLGFVFEYHTPNCGTAPNCWKAESVAGVSSPVASASWTTQIPRSAFPHKGEWRLRARGLGQAQAKSGWSKWRDFRVKRSSECP